MHFANKLATKYQVVLADVSFDKAKRRAAILIKIFKGGDIEMAVDLNHEGAAQL